MQKKKQQKTCVSKTNTHHTEGITPPSFQGKNFG